MKLHASAKDRKLIDKIVVRAFKADKVMVDLSPTTKLDLTMDLLACHLNGNELDLQALLSEETNFNFFHDILGIVRHLNRRTGRLMNGFSPRFTKQRPVRK